jgi:hypothetical protein
VDRFIADIDRDRQFWRDGAGRDGLHHCAGPASIVAAVLDWAAGDGFLLMADDNDWDFRTPAEFRQRHMIAGMARLMKG